MVSHLLHSPWAVGAEETSLIAGCWSVQPLDPSAESPRASVRLPLAWSGRTLRIFYQRCPGFGVHKNPPEGSVVFVKMLVFGPPCRTPDTVHLNLKQLPQKALMEAGRGARLRCARSGWAYRCNGDHPGMLTVHGWSTNQRRQHHLRPRWKCRVSGRPQTS